MQGTRRNPFAATSAAVLLLALAALPWAGCGDETTTPPIDPDLIYPADLSTPENVLEQLQVAYRRREIGPYAELLAPEFRFVFQPQDAQDLPTDVWTRAQDSIGTGNLLQGLNLVNSGNVTSIEIELTLNPSDPSPVELEGFPGIDAWRVRVINTFLDVNLSNRITLRVSGDQQDFFFRRGIAPEDTTRWFILQWQDLGGSAKPGVEANSWGRLKALSR